MCLFMTHWAAVLSVLLLAGLTGCSRDSSATASPPKGQAPKAREVRVVPAVEARMPRTVAVTGTLAAEEQIVLSLKVTGRLAELTVDLGSPVRRGQVVARVDPTDFQLRLEQAEAALQQARVRLGLAAKGTDDRVEADKTSIARQARALLDEARLNRERSVRLAELELIARAQLDTAVAAEVVAEGRYQDALEEARNRQGMLAQRRSELELARQQLDARLRGHVSRVVLPRAHAGDRRDVDDRAPAGRDEVREGGPARSTGAEATAGPAPSMTTLEIEGLRSVCANLLS